MPGDETRPATCHLRRLCSVGPVARALQAVDYHHAIDMLESLGARHLAMRQQAVLIAQALMTDPELLLDERRPEPRWPRGWSPGWPTTAADPACALVLVTHVEEISARLQPLLLSEARVVAAGLLPDALTAENLSRRVCRRSRWRWPTGVISPDGVTGQAAHRRQCEFTSRATGTPTPTPARRRP